MSKFDSKAKVITLTTLVASTAIVTYASQEKMKTSDVDVETAKLVIDKIDSDTVKVSVDNVNNSAKAFQLSLKVDGNATFKEESINWLTNSEEDGNGNIVVDDKVTNNVKVSSDNKKIDIFVASNEELKRNGSMLEVCKIDLAKTGVAKNSTYKIVPSTESGKVSYKSIDENNKSLEVASMIYDETSLSFNTPPTIALKASANDETNNENTPVIDIENNIITIMEGYEFDPKLFVEVNDADESLGIDNIEVSDADGKVISEVINNLKSGSHEINYKVTDSASESATLKVNINVKPEIWTTKPILIGIPTEDIVIETGDVFNPFMPDGKTQITAKDAKDSNLEVKLESTFDLEVAGTYKLTYKATDRFDNIATQDVNLVVNENNAPVLTGIEDKVINAGTEFDPLEGIDVTDETATIEDIKISGKVNVNLPGSYRLVYEVSDGKKTTKAQRNVTVNGAPSISGDLSYMIVKTGTQLSDSQILENITATDDIDGDVSGSLNVNKGNLDTSKDGNYVVTITATDSSNLTASVTKNIIVTSKNIVDLPGSEDGSSTEKTIKKQVVDESAISEINSKLTNLTKENKIDLTKTTLGDQVIYNLHITPNKIAFTNNNNEYYVDITVPKSIDDSTGGIVVTQYEAIKVSSITVSGNNGEMKVGEKRVLDTKVSPENADNKELLWTSTNNDIVSIAPSKDTQSITITALKKGTSTIRVMATDGSEVYEELVVQVGEQPKEDTEAPTFDYNGKTDIVLANGAKFEIPVVTASDNVDTGIEVSVSITNSEGKAIDSIDTKVAGKYVIKYTAKDKSDNKSELLINVTVKESIPGIEIGSGDASSIDKALEIKITDNVEALKNLLKLIEDDKYQAKLNGNPIIDEYKNEITYNIMLNKKQGFIARLFKANEDNKTHHLRLTANNNEEFKNILDKLEIGNNAPTINASDKTIKVGDKFDALNEVSASDKEDGDITSNIEVVENNVDTDKVGKYTVTYSVKDSNGAQATKTVTVKVQSEEIVSPEEDVTPEVKPDEEVGTDEGTTPEVKPDEEVGTDEGTTPEVKPDEDKTPEGEAGSGGATSGGTKPENDSESNKDKNPGISSPKTGDSGILGYAITGVVAMGAIVGINYKKNKK